MRRESGSKRFRLELNEGSWRLSQIASLEHSTLPWWSAAGRKLELEGFSIDEVSSFTRRERLSILGQIAAHFAFLRLAGIACGAFDSSQWIIMRRRNEDPRAVRIAPDCDARDESAATFLSRAAEALAVGDLDSLAGSWIKADGVYAEIEQLIVQGPKKNFRHSGIGWVRAPGAAMIERLSGERRARCRSDESAIRALECFGARQSDLRVIALGADAHPLRLLSAVAPLVAVAPLTAGDETAGAEALERAFASIPVLFVIRHGDRFDPASLQIVRLLFSGPGNFSWMVCGSLPAGLPEEAFESAERWRAFVVSPRLEAQRDLLIAIDALPFDRGREFMEELCESAAFNYFLVDGVLPVIPAAVTKIEEPRRSFLAALAVVGEHVALEPARAILEQLGWHRPLTELASVGIARVGPEGIDLEKNAARELEASIPQEARSMLCRIASGAIESIDPWRAALLSLEAGDEGPLRLLNGSVAALEPRRRAEVEGALQRMPLAQRHRVEVARLESELHFRAGRYRRARLAALSLPEGERELMEARALRRLGNYDAAGLQAEKALGAGLRAAIPVAAELARLRGDGARAIELVETLNGNDEEAAAGAFERALIALDSDEPVSAEAVAVLQSSSSYGARLAAYSEVRRGKLSEAADHARRAIELSSDVPSRIDASLDLMFALFLAGEWEEARRQARETLALVEETEGDRAAGGVLFTLAWLSADSGDWDSATEMLARLRAFYSATSDARRLRETDLVAAHLAFTRGDLAEARSLVRSLSLEGMSPEERQAALLILDESDAMEGIVSAPRSIEESCCLELNDRQRLLRFQEHEPDSYVRPFNGELARWLRAVSAGHAASTPIPSDRSESLKLLRAMASVRSSQSVGSLEGEIAALSGQLGVRIGTLPARAVPNFNVELDLLQRVATLPFPFIASDLPGIGWRFAQRNRLGSWAEIGSLAPLETESLDRLLEQASGDWLRCGNQALLFIEGCSEWSEGSRTSIAKLFMMRSEHYNLKRAASQDSTIADRAAEEADGIVGASQAIVQLRATIARVARGELPVCIEGESGVGKELVARAIHRASARCGRPFVALNCAAIPDNLVESELFGHARGAFTGADRDRIGMIETADRGTLFLDEIGEMPLPAQAKLLRFLQEGEMRRVGETGTRTADVRVIAATNRRLEGEVDAGRFREDLYYRIRGIELRVPPLRERPGDIILLARTFLDRANGGRTGPSRFSSDAETLLQSHSWPGNIRELEHAVRSAHLLAGDAREIEVEHLPERIRQVRPLRKSAGAFFDEVNLFRRRLVEQSLEQAGGNQSHAARLLGLSRQALGYQIRELGIVVPPRR